MLFQNCVHSPVATILLLFPAMIFAQAPKAEIRCDELLAKYPLDLAVSIEASRPLYILKEVTSGGITFFYNPFTGQKESGTNVVAVTLEPSASPKYTIGTWVSAGLRQYFDPSLRQNGLITHTVYELIGRDGLRIGWINTVDAIQKGLPLEAVDTFADLSPGLLEALIDRYGLTVYPDEKKALAKPKD